MNSKIEKVWISKSFNLAGICDFRKGKQMIKAPGEVDKEAKIQHKIREEET